MNLFIYHFTKPFRCRRFRIRNQCIRGSRKAVLPMCHITMTIPAGLSFSYLRHHIIDTPGRHKLGIELCMTTDTIVHDYFCTFIICFYYLMFATSEKHRNMTHTIHALERPLLYRILMRNMTIITRSIPSVRAVHPGGIIGSHDMAIDASCRVVAQISMRPEHIQEKQPSPDNQTGQGQWLPSSSTWKEVANE